MELEASNLFASRPSTLRLSVGVLEALRGLAPEHSTRRIALYGLCALALLLIGLEPTAAAQSVPAANPAYQTLAAQTPSEGTYHRRRPGGAVFSPPLERLRTHRLSLPLPATVFIPGPAFGKPPTGF